MVKEKHQELNVLEFPRRLSTEWIRPDYAEATARWHQHLLTGEYTRFLKCRRDIAFILIRSSSWSYACKGLIFVVDECLHS